MSPAEPGPGGGERLGDVIRVVAALRELDPDDGELVALLLPAPARVERGSRGAAAPRGAAMAPAAHPGADRHDARPPRASERASAGSATAARLADGTRRVVRAWSAALASAAARIAAIRGRRLAVAAGALLVLPVLASYGLPPSRVQALLLGAALLALLVLAASRLVALLGSPILRFSVTTDAASAAGARVDRGAPPARLGRTRYAPPPRAAPIVGALRGRALAVGLAGVSVPGSLDVRRLVEDIARGRPRQAPPRLVRRSLRRGVQLVVDRGPALDPLRDDVVDLAGRLAQVASPAGLQQLGFRGDPLVVTGATRPRVDPDEPVSYRAVVPRPGSAVVVVCDLGIARTRSGPPPATPATWLAWDRLVRQAGCRAIYLVPYPPSRWPRALAERLAIVHWRDDLRLDELLAPGARRRP